MNKLKKVVLFHPFSAKAIGLSRVDLLKSHSKPHTLSLLALQGSDYLVRVDYFDFCFLPKFKQFEGLKKWFWPISFPLFAKASRWRKEFSVLHLIYTYFKPPDLSIINMSGNLSPYTLKYASLLLAQHKPYIAMVGGLHMSVNKAALDYYKNAQHIIVHTRHQKAAILEMKGFESLNIKVIPLGVNADLFAPKYNSLDGAIDLLYVGRISRLKQIELAIEALDFCKTNGILNIKLTIVGPISDSGYYDELIQIIESKDLVGNVCVVGPLAHEQLVSFYQNATLLLLPSAHESFGMVAIESMSCGTPVVALKGSGGPTEVVVNEMTGILCEKKQYSKCVFELLTEKKLYTKLCENCRQSVVENWSITTTIDLIRQSVLSCIN